VEPIRTLIVDDEPLARRRIAQLLTQDVAFVLMGECRNGAEAVARLATPTPDVDLVFLDVQMPDLSGLQVLQQVPPQQVPLVVFVTAYDRYTLQAFEAHAIDYLLKPLDPDRFQRCLAHVQHLMRQRTPALLPQQLQALLRAVTSAAPVALPPPELALPEQLLVKENGRLFFVALAQVQYLAAQGNYVVVHTQGQVHSLRTTLSQLKRQLDPAQFLQIHRSLIVNSAFIKELRPWAHGEYLLTLHDETHLTSSRSYSEQLQQFLQRFAH
jgi:two-component system LytT family response regulator